MVALLVVSPLCAILHLIRPVAIFRPEALLPIARRITIGLGHQERKLRDELTPTLNGLRQLAETTPPDTRAHQQTEFIIATIQHMFEDAKGAELRAGQIVADLENELAKGSDPLDQAGI